MPSLTSTHSRLNLVASCKTPGISGTNTITAQIIHIIALGMDRNEAKGREGDDGWLAYNAWYLKVGEPV